MSNKKDKKKSKKLEIKLFTSKTDMIVSIILIVIMIAFFLSPRIFWITTAKWTDWDKDNKNNVVTAMGKENTEERFRLYFQYYNVLHEMGHGLLIYNKGVDVHIVDEEQLVNDFAVAYWNYYGEEEKMKELYDIVTYAVENVGDNHKKGIDYIKNAKEHSGKIDFIMTFLTLMITVGFNLVV